MAVIQYKSILYPPKDAREEKLRGYVRLRNFILVLHPVFPNRIKEMYRIDDPSIRYKPRTEMTVTEAQKRDSRGTLSRSIERIPKKYVVYKIVRFANHKHFEDMTSQNEIFETNDYLEAMARAEKWSRESTDKIDVKAYINNERWRGIYYALEHCGEEDKDDC